MILLIRGFTIYFSGKFPLVKIFLDDRVGRGKV